MNPSKANIVARCIENEMNVSLDVIRSRSKKRDHCTARALFIGLWMLMPGFDSAAAGEYLSRSREEINHIRRQHANWLGVDRKYNSLFSTCREAYKSQLPDLNDIELAEVQSELEHRLQTTQQQLARVMAERGKRNAIGKL